jgi:hypothetical protein
MIILFLLNLFDMYPKFKYLLIIYILSLLYKGPGGFYASRGQHLPTNRQGEIYGNRAESVIFTDLSIFISG